MYELTCPSCQAKMSRPFARVGAVATCDACGHQWRIERAHMRHEPPQVNATQGQNPLLIEASAENAAGSTRSPVGESPSLPPEAADDFPAGSPPPASLDAAAPASPNPSPATRGPTGSMPRSSTSAAEPRPPAVTSKPAADPLVPGEEPPAPSAPTSHAGTGITQWIGIGLVLLTVMLLGVILYVVYAAAGHRGQPADPNVPSAGRATTPPAAPNNQRPNGPARASADDGGSREPSPSANGGEGDANTPPAAGFSPDIAVEAQADWPEPARIRWDHLEPRGWLRTNWIPQEPGRVDLIPVDQTGKLVRVSQDRTGTTGAARAQIATPGDLTLIGTELWAYLLRQDDGEPVIYARRKMPLALITPETDFGVSLPVPPVQWEKAGGDKPQLAWHVDTDTLPDARILPVAQAKLFADDDPASVRIAIHNESPDALRPIILAIRAQNEAGFVVGQWQHRREIALEPGEVLVVEGTLDDGIPEDATAWVVEAVGIPRPREPVPPAKMTEDSAG